MSTEFLSSKQQLDCLNMWLSSEPSINVNGMATEVWVPEWLTLYYYACCLHAYEISYVKEMVHEPKLSAICILQLHEFDQNKW